MIGWTLAMLLGIVLMGCSKSDEHPTPKPPHGDVIQFGVQSVDEVVDSRALINSLADLQTACKPDTLPGGRGRYIWLWGSFKSASQLEQIQTPFNRRKLFYNLGDNAYQTKWNYEGQKETWQIGATYVFRALYSDNLEGLEVRGNDAVKLQVKYSTLLSQDDVLAASGVKNNPVRLNFKHVLAAVRFQFKYKPKFDKNGVEHIDGIANDEDFITECWLENVATDADLNAKIGCFATVGSMNYGQGTIGGSDADREAMFWQSNLCEKKMYLWKPATSNTEVRFGNVTTGNKTTVTLANTYKGATTEGGLYANNNGWVLIVPNYVTCPLQLCFKTKMNGNNVYRVILNRLAKDAPAQGNHNFEYQGKYYQPIEFKHNMRYTYTIIFRATDLDIDVDIKPWNRVDISDEIVY